MANPTVDPNDKSFSGGIMALMKALRDAYAPRGLVQRPQAIENAVNGVGQPSAPAPGPLGNPQAPGGLGNQSPGLGNSF